MNGDYRGKPATKVSEQIEILQKRGLLFKDLERAKCIMHHVNYYRIRGYYIDFYFKDNEFRKNTYFEDIYNTYEFDMRFKKSLLPILEVVEISIKTILAYYLGNEVGPIAYLDENIYFYTDTIDILMCNFEKYRSNHQSSLVVKKHEEYYGGIYPIWVWIEFLSFGDVSLMLNGIKKDYLKKINNDYFLFPKAKGFEFLISWYRSLAKFRNKCSHYERLYDNFINETPPKITLDSKLNSEFRVSDNRTIFYSILVADMLCPDITVINDFINDVLVANKYNISLKDKYGFPDNWEKLLLTYNGYYLQYLY